MGLMDYVADHRQHRSLPVGARAFGSWSPTYGAKPPGTIAYGSLRADLPADQELAELRRQQAALHGLTGRLELDPRNLWLAAGALAPPLAILGLEGGAALAARSALPAARRAALDFMDREPFICVGDNYATRIGRMEHARLKAKVEAKPGWESEPKLQRPGARPLRPDAGAPMRDPASDKRYLMELKPNTPSGRRAGARSVRKYEAAKPGSKTRVIYYDPKDSL